MYTPSRPTIALRAGIRIVMSSGARISSSPSVAISSPAWKV
jgi:hypothetical protein